MNQCFFQLRNSWDVYKRGFKQLKKVKIFMGLGDTCGYYSHLERGLKTLNVSCTFVNAYPDRVYKRDYRPSLLGRLVEWLAVMRVNSDRGSVTRKCWTALQACLMPLLFLTSIFCYNVFIFAGGTSFFRSFDLYLLKLLRKRVIVVFHGSDSRAPYISALLVGTEGDFDVNQCILETKKIKKHLQMIEKYADVIVNNPTASHLHERQIINWHVIGIPYKCPTVIGQQPKFEASPCVIVHAPTRPVEKGSPQIEQAIDSLRSKGHDIKFIKLIGRTNAEVLENIADCDFVVDELFSDVFMASFATEAASYGKPAVVGLYEYEKVKACISDESMIPPVLLCTVDCVEGAIERLITDKEYRLQMGSDARSFVEKQWNAEVVAKRFLLLAENKIPQSWWFDPKIINRLYGWGLTDQRAREVIRAIIEHGGVSALHLPNNPILEQNFIDFSCAKSPLC